MAVFNGEPKNSYRQKNDNGIGGIICRLCRFISLSPKIWYIDKLIGGYMRVCIYYILCLKV